MKKTNNNKAKRSRMSKKRGQRNTKRRQVDRARKGVDERHPTAWLARTRKETP